MVKVAVSIRGEISKAFWESLAKKYHETAP